VKHEENEHSLEMHLPFIKKVFKDEGKPDVKLVPLMVGELPKEKYKNYAKKLLPLFKDERTVFIVSSDFCHWGENFDYYKLHPGTPDQEIYKSIERMDRDGMELIENHSL
jgi:AmmeMemoRadiSam system protein B